MTSKLFIVLVSLASTAAVFLPFNEGVSAERATNGSHSNHHQSVRQNDQQIAITMPDIRPDHAEQYLCVAHRLPANQDGQFIVGFNPKSDASRVHHMLVYGCQMPGIFQRYSPNFVWDCSEMQSTSNDGEKLSNSFEEGPVCQRFGKQQILYGWALDAPALKLPEGVGFKVGGDTDMNFLVLQVHYGHYDDFQNMPDLTDNSGLILNTKLNNPDSGITKQAGVLLLISLGYVLPGKSEHEIYCNIEEDIEIHPFRFRAHTHKLGTRVFGAKLTDQDESTSGTVLDKSIIIGSGDPQEPQMFYPVREENLTIKGGDTVYARCEYNNNKTQIVKIGRTGDDEMCNFYIMYWTQSPKLLSKANCFSQNPRRSIEQSI